MMQPDDELTSGERRALGRLPRQAQPPARLEHATVAALTARGLLRRPRRRFHVALALAASVLFLVGGFVVGRFGGEAATPIPDGRRFVLFLYEGPEYAQPAPEALHERVREYAAWANQTWRNGAVEGGEKLKDGEVLAIGPDASIEAAPAAAAESRLAGYFLIRAADHRAAIEIARNCPHLRYGGRVVVREIDPT